MYNYANCPFLIKKMSEWLNEKKKEDKFMIENNSFEPSILELDFLKNEFDACAYHKLFFPFFTKYPHHSVLFYIIVIVRSIWF